VSLSETSSSDRMISLVQEIFPLPRMINSPGMDRAFDIVKRELPAAVIHEFPSGSECGDWIVPESWQVIEGQMKDSSGKIVASIDENLLFVAPYSEPVEGWFTKEDIRKHLRTRPDRANAFALEHRNAYNYKLVDWGITLPHNRWIDLPEGRYHIHVEVERKPSTMKLAEYFLEGLRTETICICAHVDELCNDDLSGCVVAIELMRKIARQPNHTYSYQMLLAPEMFGPIFFIHNNPGRIRDIVGVLNLETVGAGREWCLKKALKGGHRLEDTLRSALQKAQLPFREIDFFEGYGNDERVFAWPTRGIPGVSIQRFPFDQYHTSDDTPEIVDKNYLQQALTLCGYFVDILENDYVPEYTQPIQPWLTKRGLYYESIDNVEDNHKFNNLTLFNINGKNSVIDLAQKSGLTFFQIYEYVEKFADQGLIRKHPVQWGDDRK